MFVCSETFVFALLQTSSKQQIHEEKNQINDHLSDYAYSFIHCQVKNAALA